MSRKWIKRCFSFWFPCMPSAVEAVLEAFRAVVESYKVDALYDAFDAPMDHVQRVFQWLPNTLLCWAPENSLPGYKLRADECRP